MDEKAELIAELDNFAKGYIEALLWTTNGKVGDTGLRDEGYTIQNLSLGALKKCKADCEAFQEANRENLNIYEYHINQDSAYAGHDLWLTRNHHGAGFWDRVSGTGVDIKDTLIALTTASHAVGEVDAYLGDDDEVHLEVE